MEKAFIKGIGDAAVRYKQPIKEEIMKLVGINNDVSWMQWMNGELQRRPSLAERNAIEDVFKKYGVDNPWGKK